MTQPGLVDALDELADVFGDSMTGLHVGGLFTCSEAETIDNVLRLSGHYTQANAWLHAHAEEDGAGDLHDICRLCGAVLYVTGLDDENITALDGGTRCPPHETVEHVPSHQEEDR